MATPNGSYTHTQQSYRQYDLHITYLGCYRIRYNLGRCEIRDSDTFRPK